MLKELRYLLLYQIKTMSKLFMDETDIRHDKVRSRTARAGLPAALRGTALLWAFFTDAT